jgi:hypothetical protein
MILAETSFVQPRSTHIARLGEHAAAAWKSVKRNPLLANLSRFGVLISPPKQLRSLKPRSSATMTRKLGLFGASLALSEGREFAMVVYRE